MLEDRMKKHIRVVTPQVTSNGFSQAECRRLERDDLEISTATIEIGPVSIECQFESSLAIPDTCAKVIAAEKEGVHAVVLDCLGDVGLYEARECVSIPVLGPFETCAHLASVLAYKYSVITMVDEVVAIMESYAKRYGAADRLASIRAIKMPVLEMERDRATRDQRLVECAVRVVREDGAAAIILGCSGMSGAAEMMRKSLLAEGIDVPVIDPVPTTVLLAAALVDAGISHSKKSFPAPPAKKIVGYDFLNL
jgi:allantoin racemase